MNRCYALEAISWRRWLVSGPSPRTSGFITNAGHVVCVVDKVSQTGLFPEHFDFFLSLSFHQCCIFINRPRIDRVL